MTPQEEFETNLREVVTAKRLSASKMTALTELAMKNMQHDTQLVSILYRTHKSLPSAASKISSLYIFDALSRAAKSYATKHNLSGDMYTQPGNAATFLQKVGGVVEGLFQDMLAIGSPEAKEKTKKILDIWVKGNTFPATILSQLSDVLNGEDKKVPVPNLAISVDPRAAHVQSTYAPPTPAVHTPVVQALDPQAALLALLTQAAANTTNISASQTVANLGTSAGHLDAAQLAVIQQLAHTAASVPSVPQFLPPPESVNVQKFPSSSGVNGSSLSLPSYRDEPRTMVRSEQRHSGYRSPESDSRSNPHFDDRDNMRGRYRGGFRNRGRGDRMGRWDDRDRDQYRDSERDTRSPPRSFRGRSRSRSPPRNGDRKPSRFHSPPRRPQPASPPPRQMDSSIGKQNEPGKDEFGRDIRPESPKSPVIAPNSPSPPLASPPNSTAEPRLAQSAAAVSDPKPDDTPVTPLVTPIAVSSSTSSAPITESKSTAQLGMETFNLATFDYTSPASWEALGKMWQVTNGYLPSTEQLMQFVVSYGTGQQVDSTMQPVNQDFSKQSYPPSTRGRGRGRGGGHLGRGRGGSSYGNGRNTHSDMDYDTDAIVLGGGDGAESGGRYPDMNGGQPYAAPPPQESQAALVSSGKMQRVGDKWVFVRGAAMDVS